MRHNVPRSLFRLVVVTTVALVCCLVLRAKTPAPTVQVIPRPRQMTLSEERFQFPRRAAIALANPRSEDDRFAAQDFIDDLKQTASINLQIGRGKGAILIGIVDLPAVQSALRQIGLDVPADLDDEGYVLGVNEKQIVVGGKTAAGVFYGIQTLKQLVRGEGADAYVYGVKITDWPALRWRGVSDDISRGPVPTLEYVKRQLRTEAMFKLNMHSFYMEHTFASAANPLIGPVGGSLTPGEIREAVAYAKRYHIEVVPEQQTFGHLHKALRLEKYAGLAETPYGDVISPQQEGSYKLVADWYKELNDLFPGRFFHIGEDETFELGEGQSREAAKAKGVGAIYFEHLNRVREVLKPYNRRLMFWGDIALNHPNLIGNIPRDLIVMNWDYGSKDDFTSRLKPFKDAGLDQFVCPGIHSWNQIFPNLNAASKNIINFVRDGKTARVMGMMNTSWDDDGESLFEMGWYAIVLGGAASWQDQTVKAEEFDRDFDWAFFRSEGDTFVKDMRVLGGVSDVLSLRGTTDEIFWHDPFTTELLNEARTKSEAIKRTRLSVENVQESLMQNRQHARRNSQMIPGLFFAAQRFDHLGRRMQVVEKFSNQYWDAYLNLGDRTKARRLRYYSGAIYNNLREMAEELSLLRESYRQQWLAENRPYWLDSVLARYDEAISIWLKKSRDIDEALRRYEATSTLPAPEDFGLGPRPVVR